MPVYLSLDILKSRQEYGDEAYVFLQNFFKSLNDFCLLT